MNEGYLKKKKSMFSEGEKFLNFFPSYKEKLFLKKKKLFFLFIVVMASRTEANLKGDTRKKKKKNHSWGASFG